MFLCRSPASVCLRRRNCTSIENGEYAGTAIVIFSKHVSPDPFLFKLALFHDDLPFQANLCVLRAKCFEG